MDHVVTFKGRACKVQFFTHVTTLEPQDGEATTVLKNAARRGFTKLTSVCLNTISENFAYLVSQREGRHSRERVKLTMRSVLQV